MASSGGGFSVDILVAPLFRLRAAINLNVATAVLLVYDHFLTFSDEVTLVWPSRWSFTKALFNYNRYSPYVDAALSLHILFGPHSRESCKPTYMLIAYLIIVGGTVSEMILMIRTYALWNRDRRVFWCFVVMMGAIFPANIVITDIFFRSLNYLPSPVPDLAPCYAPYQGDIIWIEFLLFSIMETVLIILTFIKGYDHLKHIRTRLVYTLYEDGLLYYICFLVISIANVMMLFFAPVELKNALVSPLRVLHSILSTRVILHIRACVHKRQARYRRYLESPCVCVCNCTPVSRPGTGEGSSKEHGGRGSNDNTPNDDTQRGDQRALSPQNDIVHLPPMSSNHCHECTCNCGRELDEEYVDRNIWKRDWRWWRTWDAEPMSIAEFTFTHQLLAELGEGRNESGAARRSNGRGVREGGGQEDNGEKREKSIDESEERGYPLGWLKWLYQRPSALRAKLSPSRLLGRERHSFAQPRSRSHSLTTPTSATQFTFAHGDRNKNAHDNNETILLSPPSFPSQAKRPRLPAIIRAVSTGMYNDEYTYKQQDIEMEDLSSSPVSPVSVLGSRSALVPIDDHVEPHARKPKTGDG